MKVATRQVVDVARLTYDTNSNASKVINVSPDIEQGRLRKVLNAVTDTGASTQMYTFNKREVTVCVIATGVTSGGTFTFEGSADGGSNWGTVGSVDNAGTVATTQAITANGTFFFEIANASTLEYFRVNLSSRTDGTYTVYVMAGV